MDVKTVCLGLLTFGEATGYDLKKHFEASFDEFFSTGFGSIYPALAALADDGLAECTAVPQEGRPSRKVYRITPAGEAALRRTLATCNPGHKVRSELLALLYFSDLVPPERVSALLDSRIAEMQQGLARMRVTGCPGEQRWPNSVRFVQGFGVALLEAATDYMTRNRHLLEPAVAKSAKPAARKARRAA